MAGEERKIKCVVWDLDNTLWSGVLAEGDRVGLFPGVRDIVKRLDERGILQSVASRNDPDEAIAALKDFQIAKYFIHPQIGWGAKSTSIGEIARLLNIGADSIAFIDDDRFERGEVADVFPEVLCLGAGKRDRLVDMPEFQPRFVTAESQQRRSMYLADMEREQAAIGMPQEQFLRSLGMVFTISEAQESDLARVDELTERTNQLNSTGFTYSLEELERLRSDPNHKLLVAGLDDCYGTYGKIGAALIETREDVWLIKLLLMSCRVMARGVGKILLSHILSMAGEEVGCAQAQFIRTARNRLMYTTFKFAGFRELSRDGEIVLLQHDLERIDPFPGYAKVVFPR